MLIPRYSLRRILLVMTGVAVFCVVISMAVQGRPWAIGTVTAVASLLAAFLLYSVVFLVAWLMARVSQSVRPRQPAANPFATAGPPPQIIPPDDPE